MQSRLLPFWRELPRAWFVQFEAVLDPLKTSDDQKFRYLLQQLQAVDLQHLTDILYNPPATDKYLTVKNRLLAVYDKSDVKNFQKLISGLELGDQKPSQLLRREDIRTDVDPSLSVHFFANTSSRERDRQRCKHIKRKHNGHIPIIDSTLTRKSYMNPNRQNRINTLVECVLAFLQVYHHTDSVPQPQSRVTLYILECDDEATWFGRVQFSSPVNPTNFSYFGGVQQQSETQGTGFSCSYAGVEGSGNSRDIYYDVVCPSDGPRRHHLLYTGDPIPQDRLITPVLETQTLYAILNIRLRVAHAFTRSIGSRGHRSVRIDLPTTAPFNSVQQAVDRTLRRPNLVYRVVYRATLDYQNYDVEPAHPYSTYIVYKPAP